MSADGEVIRNVAGVAEELVMMPPPPVWPPLVTVPVSGPIHWSLPARSKVPPVATERPLLVIQVMLAGLAAGAAVGAEKSRFAPASWSVPALT